jgi:arylsulfatase A-like enzyme
MNGNIILITIDSLRSDRIGYISKKNLTPNIDQLSREGTSFTNCFANGPNTLFSTPSFFIKNHHPFKDFSTFRKEITVVEELKARGIFTAGFVAKNYWVSRYLNFHRGFQYFDDYFDTDNNGMIKDNNGMITNNNGIINTLFSNIRRERSFITNARNFIKKTSNTALTYYLPQEIKRASVLYPLGYLTDKYKDVETSKSGEVITNDVILKIKENLTKPFFIWAHYMDVHTPYIPPRGYTSLSPLEIIMANKEMVEVIKNGNKPSKKLLKTLKLLYDQEVQYLDMCIGKLISFLKEIGIYNKTTIIFTSDHGDLFYEHGKFDHGSDKGFYDPLIKVPLIIKGRNFPKNMKIDYLTELRDIPVTIKHIATGKEDLDYSGTSILTMLENKKGHDMVCSKSKHEEFTSLKEKFTPLRIESFQYSRYCLRTKNYKLIFDEKSSKYELYDIINDNNEDKNIFELKKGISSKMKKLMDLLIQKYKIKSQKEKIRSIAINKELFRKNR